MERQTAYKPESIYDNYLSPEAPRHSLAPSAMSAGTDRFSLAPPMPRGQHTGRNTALSMADTSSVYSTNNGPASYGERWSLEQGLAGMENGSSADVYARASTHRPSIPSTAGTEIYNGANIPRMTVSSTAPVRADTHITTSMSPAPIQYNRRHFSRPLRQDDGLQPGTTGNANVMTTPQITVGHHRFSASTPDAYGGADVSSPAVDNDSPRSSTYSSDIAAFPDPTHLRRRSMPVSGIPSNQPGDRSSIDSSTNRFSRAFATGHANKNSLSGLSIIESEDEVVIPSERPSPHPRPFSLSNTYPFTTSQNGYGSQQTVRTLNHKPSSRFSEDEKRENVKTMSSNNDLQSSTWNLFGRTPAASPMWRTNEKFPEAGPSNTQQSAAQARRKKKITFIAAGVLLALILAGAGAGIGVWQNNLAQTRAKEKAAKADSASDTTSGDASGTDATKTDSSPAKATAKSADVTIPARDTDATPGSGGLGGYNQLVAFGGSYTDNGHPRAAQFQSSLQADQGYAGGRSTNGNIYQEYLADLIGPREGETSLVFNYAYSGASLNNSITTFAVPDLPQQISTYLGDLNSGNATVTASGNSKALVTVWAGMEELVTIWEAAFSQDPAAPGPIALANVQRMITTLSTSLPWLIAQDSTATNRPDFVLISLPPGDLLPQTARLGQNNSLFIDTFKNMTDTFNTGLTTVAASLSAATVYALDAQSLFSDLYKEPSLYNLTTVTTSCRQDNCNDPAGYLWYDDFNPTTTMHRLVARRLAAAILSH